MSQRLVDNGPDSPMGGRGGAGGGSGVVSAFVRCCCKSKSTCVMYTVNVVLFILAIIVTAVAGVLQTHRSDIVQALPDSQQAVPAGAVGVALAAGVLLMVLALVGLVGTAMYERCCGKTLLTAYSGFVILVLLLHIIAAGMAFTVAGEFQTFKEWSQSADSSFNAPTGTNADIAAFANSTYQYCCPHQQVSNAQVCQILSAVVTTDNCASLVTFDAVLMDYLTSKFRGVGAGALVLSLLEACVLTASCCLLCRARKSEEAEGYYSNAEYTAVPGQRRA